EPPCSTPPPLRTTPDDAQPSTMPLLRVRRRRSASMRRPSLYLRYFRPLRGRLGGGHETSGQPGAAPPHPPPQPAPRDVGHAQLREAVAIPAGGEDVGDQQPPTRSQHAHGRPDRPVTARPALDVVECDAGEDEVEAALREGQSGHVGGEQRDAVGDPLGPGITPRRLGRVARLVCSPPEVYAHRPTDREP